MKMEAKNGYFGGKKLDKMWKIKKNLGAGDPSVPQSKLASKSSEQTALKKQNIKKKIPSQI